MLACVVAGIFPSHQPREMATPEQSQTYLQLVAKQGLLIQRPSNPEE